jgi:hypothetical protein
MLGHKILAATVLTFVIAILPGKLVGPANAGETLSGTYSEVVMSTQELVLANGSTVLYISTKGSGTFGDPANPGILTGDCVVSAVINADGSYGGDTGYCNWAHGDEGTYVGNFTTGSDGKGTYDVVGGSGKWEGATGSGTYEGTWDAGDKFGGTYQVTIN